MPTQGNGETILLVEDERTTAEMVRHLLESLGYRVLRTSNGHDALILYRRFAPDIDLIVTDMMMPRMTGVELIRAIRRISASVSIIALSGSPRQDFPRDLRHTITCWLRKPADVSRLAVEVHRALNESD